MDSYTRILQDFWESWQQLKKLELPYLQEKEAFDALFEKIIINTPNFTTHKTSPTNTKKTSTANSTQNSNIMHPFDRWVSVSRASEMTGLNKGVISRLASKGLIFSNGKKGKDRKLLKSTVLLVAQARNEQEYLKEARKEEHETNEIKTRIPYRY